MAYFLPSYFQKRLLRYALSRLDFIETDALDLENLGITWGQRSVIELKDVGIQVTKLTALLNIPPAILVTRAQIGLLRLTIPADLYASGIVVEIGSIDVHVRLQDVYKQQDPSYMQPRPSSGLSKGNRADRPRIDSSAIHDPGGTRGNRLRPGAVGDTGIPTSADLALSFLESEPPEERKELQSIVQSRSQYLQDSTTSAAGEGTGAPGGFELPTFVANFFKGVADRLSAEIKDVTLTLDVDLPQSESHSLDTVKLVLKVSDIDLQGVSLLKDGLSNRSRRSITVRNVEIMLLSEPSLFSPIPRSSASSSPRLSRAHTKPPSAFSKSTSTAASSPQLAQLKIQERQRPLLARSTPSQQSSKSSRNNIPALASQINPGNGRNEFYFHGDQNMKKSLVQSRAPTDLIQANPQVSPSLSHVDNRNAAEMLARRGQLDTSTEYTGLSMEDSQDLTESKLFSHEEAESMYMSAVSHEMEQFSAHNAMPGAWGWSETEDHGSDVSSNPTHLEAITPPLAMQANAKTELASSGHADSSSPGSSVPGLPQEVYLAPSNSLGTGAQPDVESFISDLITKQILSISHITVSVSSDGDSDIAMPAENSEVSQSHDDGPVKHKWKKPRVDDSMYSQISSQMFATTPGLFHDQGSRTNTQAFDHDDAQARQATAPVVDIGTISLSLDLAIGKLAVRLWQEVKRTVSVLSSNRELKPPSANPFPFELKIKETRINMCEEVADLPQEIGMSTHSQSETTADDESLLRILLTGVGLSVSSDGISTLQRFAVRKISVHHYKSSVISFSTSASVRNSLSGSKFPLSEDVVVIRQTGNSLSQTEVQMKYLNLKLDLLQADDVLTRSGGLSSLLDLGNSIVSTGTIREDSPQMKSPVYRQRSVRFEGAMEAPRVGPAVEGSYSAKMNAKIAGVSVELAGSESAILVRTSAVKLVYRKDVFGLQIDWIETNGPVLEEQSKGDVKLMITNTRLEYLNSPKESDLERLLSILTPSSDKHELEADDDIMVDTLIRQRRKGGVLRLTLASIDGKFDGLHWQTQLTKLGEELSRLSSVSKYLPEDDRPGMLTLALIKKISFKLALNPQIGTFTLNADLAEAAHVNVPALMAAHVTSVQVLRDEDRILGDVVSSTDPKLAMSPPMIMVRYIADEMEPTIRIKLSNLLLEYKVPTVAALVELMTSLNSEIDDSRPLSPTSSTSSSSDAAVIRSRNQVKVLLVIRDSALALNPLNSPAKGLVLMSDTCFSYAAAKGLGTEAELHLKKASLFVRDKSQSVTAPVKNADSKMFFDESLQVQEMVQRGFVPISFLSGASIRIRISPVKSRTESKTDIEFNNGLLILETCADSTQTMIQVLNGLSPPSVPSKVEKYRTEIVPIQDMLASFTGNAYFTEPGPMAGLPAMPGIDEAVNEAEDGVDLENSVKSEEPGEDDDPDFIGQLWQSRSEAVADEMSESYLDSELQRSNASVGSSVPPVATTKDVLEASREDVMVHSMLDFREDHFSRKEAVGGTAHRWDSKQNTYGLGSAAIIQESPLKVKVRNMHFIWHLFDGYDWQATRDSISKAVQNIEIKTSSRRPRSRSHISPTLDVDDESEIGDFLFNSIYIGIPANRDPQELTNAINRDIDDVTSETGSYATTTTATVSPSRRPRGRIRPKRLRLERGRHHKMAFELKGISADFILFPSGSSEVESSIDVRVQDLEIIDQLPTSTWKKFATYMQDAGEREVNTNMIHIEILNVKPVADLAASEIVLKLTVLPLRLHVDQDAIDFMTRFFEFKDESAQSPATPSTPPFLQRVEVNPIRLKLDFKPKRVDYAGLRSGRTTEFMNFFVLDRADMVLRRVILYGVSGFDRMGIMLNNIWSPDVRRNQLPGVLAGLAPIRSLVDVGSGVRDLVVVPMREYKKDGRIVRSIQKGAIAFAKTTTKELINLGAKLAIGTQTVLQDTEKLLGQPNDQQRWEDQGEDEEKKQISLYADQPLGIVQGLRGAYASLERDLLLARDAIVAVPGEVMATGSATGAAQAVLKSAPTIILRPAIGASKAVGQTLLGAGNSLDRNNYRRMQEKYKRH